MRQVGPTAQKALLLLSGGIALSLARSPAYYARILNKIPLEWKKIERRKLYRAIHQLYRSQLIDYKENRDGSISIILTQEGQKVSLRYKVDDMRIKKPKEWDKKWRVIMFDIPEQYKNLRDSLRRQLRQMGLKELQKSVFVHPYECRNEIDFIIEFYNARRYVRFIEATKVDNELHLRKRFSLG
ncbi:MAG: hypothetical protein AAB740_03495 [Patescibacteria group bacterium]